MVSNVLWPLLQESSERRVPECGVLLVDSEQFFDSLRPERLFQKMLHAGIPNHLIGLWKELFRTHSVKVCFAGDVGKPIRVLVGVPQGSGWSPELATLYVDIGLAQTLAEICTGIIKLDGCPVHLLMYADDLLAANTCEAGLQEQFEKIEQISEVDGLRISYRKTAVAVFRRQGTSTGRWELHGHRGKIVESADACVKYLGFVAEADGYTAHWEYLAQRVMAAGGACLKLFAEHPLMTFSMQEIYVAKVRSVALFGADIWGWRRALAGLAVQKFEYKALCILLRAHARTKAEAMLWLSGLQMRPS